MSASMPSGKDDRDIEIIPPDQSRQRGDREWARISFENSAEAFRKLPLHKRILLGAAWLIGILITVTLIFLVVASAVLIWIPLLLTVALIAAVVVFFRKKFWQQ